MAEGFITRRGGVSGEVAPLYITATGGTTAEYNENGKRYKSHTFTTSGTFTVTSLGNGERNLVDYLIVAGGGGGGGSNDSVSIGAGGGGAGGFLHSISHSGALSQKLNKFEVSETSYVVTVGAGGNGGGVSGQGINGNNSSIFNLTAIGGGGGGKETGNGNAGGSGGGGGGASGGRLGGNGTANQGTRGCDTPTIDPSFRVGGGGGGAAFTNQDFLAYYTNLSYDFGSLHGIPGGEGLPSSIVNGNTVFYAGGGGGAAFRGGNGEKEVGGLGGRGGGGRGGDQPNGNAESGATNTGGGGGGGTRFKALGGNGGSGIVVIRYEVEAV